MNEACERAGRNPAGKRVLVLHLSRVGAPRDYHVRVARVLMGDCAQRFGGQVFALANHDLVLLCHEAGQGQAADAHAPARLPARLAKLFAVDVPDPARLTTLWRLDEDAGEVAAFLSARAGAALTIPPAISRGQPVSLAGLQEIIAKAPLPGLMVQQTGLSLGPDRARPLAVRLAPAFREVSVDLAGLRLEPLISHALGDPFLSRHCAAALDLRLIQLLQDDLAGRARLLRPASYPGVPLLLTLGLRAIVSPGFAALARRAASGGLPLWVAVPLLEATAELELLDHARGVLRLTGCQLAVNRVDPAVLGLVRLEALRPEFVVLPWGARLRQDVAEAAGLAELLRTGAAQPVLAGVDGEPALAWGQAQGIGLFAGPFLDHVQGAMRMQRCHSAAACTLTQCASRAAALAAPGRVGCANPALLSEGAGAGP